MTHKGVQIGLPDDQGCAPAMDVQLQAESLDVFHRSRIDMQEVARLSRAYVSLDCPELESLRFEGSVGSEVVYRAESRKDADWALDERSEDDPIAPKPEKQAAAADPAKTPAEPPPEEGAPGLSDASTEALRQKAESGDAAAQLDLARAQLGLAETPASLTVEADVSAGIEQLEAMARSGNADAMHALAEAYLKHPDVPVNEALIAELTKVTPTARDRLRGMAAALLTLKAAEQGSPGAVESMNDAGQAGAPSSYYALGTMYMLDRRGRMPRSQTFLRKRLKIRRKLSGRGNVDVGLHFMRLAASAGHAAAAAMLTDLGESFDSGSSVASGNAAASGSATATGSATASTSPTGSAPEPGSAGQATAGAAAAAAATTTAANLQAAGQGALTASIFSQVLEPASSPGSSAGSRSGGRTGSGSGGGSSATAGAGTASAGSGRGAAGAGGAQPGAGAAGSSPGVGVLMGSTRRTGGGGQRGRPVNSRRPQSEGNTDSETGEAEIID
jgi:hypothetical protein